MQRRAATWEHLFDLDPSSFLNNYRVYNIYINNKCSGSSVDGRLNNSLADQNDACTTGKWFKLPSHHWSSVGCLFLGLKNGTNHPAIIGFQLVIMIDLRLVMMIGLRLFVCP